VAAGLLAKGHLAAVNTRWTAGEHRGSLAGLEARGTTALQTPVRGLVVQAAVDDQSVRVALGRRRF